MNWSNVYGLPAPLVSAIKNDPYESVGDISVTSLIKSPRMRTLEKRHDKEVTEDVSDRLWALLGQSVHAILDRADTSNHLAEERMVTTLHGWIISGKPDLLTPEMILQDFKVTSVYSFMLGDKADWESQLNLYAWLYRKYGFEAKRAQIVAILRDWTKTRAEREPDYPQAGFVVKEIPLWSPEEQEAFAGGRVRAHQVAEKLSDDDLPECTPEERWQRSDSWAVKKPANKKAYRVFDNEAAARKLASETPGMDVEFRPGASVRCQSYCKVSFACSQFKKIKEAMGTVEPAEDAAA